ncbi:MAG: thiamine pyrophosphate-binding protein [Clostridia bacterium]|nr:thiamine pyrophosphate-binding protein [Clostridia bacterium]
MKLTGGEIVVKQLVEEKVPYVLGIPGHGILCFFDALRKEEEKGNIKYIQVKHEQAATAIADGYYRMSGKPLVTFSSIGPGTLNTTIGLGTAYADSTAFLQLCGDTHTHMKGVGVLQEIERYADSNIIRALEPLSKRCWRAENVRQLPKIMHRAFSQMTTGRSGPCVVTLPMDVQADACDCDIVVSKAYSAESLPSADGEYIRKAVELMKTAKRPVILCGGGALRAKVSDQIIALAKAWGAGVITTLAAKGAVSEDFDQYCFHTGSKGTAIGVEIARQADVILALGTRFADETCCSYRKGKAFNFPDTKLIQVDIDAGEIGKNYQVNVGIIADVKSALDMLIEYSAEFTPKIEYVNEIKALRKSWFDYLRDIRKVSHNKMTISQLIGIMNEILPDDTVIATSSGNTQAQLFQEYVYKQPYCNLTTGGFSTMGWAMPAGMGAKLACPDRTVISLMGDGDFMMIMQELSTMAQYNIPLIVVMANNNGWMAIKDLQLDVLGESAAYGNDFTKDGNVYSPDFCQIARSFDIDGYRVDTEDELKTALMSAVHNCRPAFIEVCVTREYPYTGGKTFGWWDVPIPAYMAEKRKIYLESINEETL